MRRFVLSALPFVCLLAVQVGQAQLGPLTSISLQNEKANNTSACQSNGSPSYCVVVGTPALPLLTSSANWNNPYPNGAQTHDAAAFPAHVSPLLISSLMPKVSGQNWNGQVVCEYQPWFSVNPNSSFGGAVYPYNSHIDIDYDEDAYDSTNNPYNSAAPNQDSVMIARGCNISFIDFFGSIDASQQFNLGTANNVYSDLTFRYNPNTATYPMKFGILEDETAFRTDCDNSPNEVTCIEGDLETDMTYVYQNYIQAQLHPNLYWADSGVNVIGFFGACGDFAHLNCNLQQRPDDWDNIWTAV